MTHHSTEVTIPAARVELAGTLCVPAGARGIVLLVPIASRHSPSCRQLANAFHDRQLATLTLDLLAADAHVTALAARLMAAISWVRASPPIAALSIGLYAEGAGAAAALIAAARRPLDVEAVVSRNGRLDLATHVLATVRAPTLLIAAEADRSALELSRWAAGRLTAPGQLATVPGGPLDTHQRLEDVGRYAASWFLAHLCRVQPESRRGLGDAMC